MNLILLQGEKGNKSLIRQKEPVDYVKKQLNISRPRDYSPSGCISPNGKVPWIKNLLFVQGYECFSPEFQPWNLFQPR